MNLATMGDRNGLVNLMGELEHRLTSRSSAPGLDPDLARAVPDGSSYLLALFDGLGDKQLSGEVAAPLLADRRFGLRAPFPRPPQSAWPRSLLALLQPSMGSSPI